MSDLGVPAFEAGADDPAVEEWVREVGFGMPDDVLDRELVDVFHVAESERHRLRDLAFELRQNGARTTTLGRPGGPSTRLAFLWGREFVSQELERRPPLLGAGADCLLPAGGLAILGGEGGAGKSTLTLHALAHFASGEPWLGVDIGRPLRVGVIENEGPKEPFVAKVEAFAGSWDGPDFLDRCAFLDSPWGGFSFADEGLRRELRAFVVESAIELLVAGPLGRLGIAGVGSPDETRQFVELLHAIGCQRDLAVWLLHHVRKPQRRGHDSIVQALAGDWGGHPDLIIGLEAQDGRRSKLTFGKVRWGNQGRLPLILEWLPETEGIGYRIGADVDIEAAKALGQANRQKILDEVTGRGRATMAELAEATGLSKPTISKHLKALAEGTRIRLTPGPGGAFHAEPIEPENDPQDGPGPEEGGLQSQDLDWR